MARHPEPTGALPDLPGILPPLSRLPSGGSSPGGPDRPEHAPAVPPGNCTCGLSGHPAHRPVCRPALPRQAEHAANGASTCQHSTWSRCTTSRYRLIAHGTACPAPHQMLTVGASFRAASSGIPGTGTSPKAFPPPAASRSRALVPVGFPASRRSLLLLRPDSPRRSEPSMRRSPVSRATSP